MIKPHNILKCSKLGAHCTGALDTHYGIVVVPLRDDHYGPKPPSLWLRRPSCLAGARRIFILNLTAHWLREGAVGTGVFRQVLELYCIIEGKVAVVGSEGLGFWSSLGVRVGFCFEMLRAAGLESTETTKPCLKTQKPYKSWYLGFLGAVSEAL